jgi:2-dehydropantoate 2-reductase
MRVVIVGCGAIGATFGVALRDSGTDLAVLDTSRQVVDLLRGEGIQVSSAHGDRRLRAEAATSADHLGTADVVLFFVKAHANEAAAAAAAPLLAPDTIVATVQNGWSHGRGLTGVVPAEQLVIGVTFNSSNVLGPGRVRHVRQGPTLLGPWEDGGPLEAAGVVADLVGASGLPARATAEIRSEMWRKLLVNAGASPVSAITRLDSVQLAARPSARRLITGLILEGARIGAGLGLDVDGHEIAAALLDRLGQLGRASMLDDIEAGRRTEIEAINGAIVQAAREIGYEAPLNESVAELVRCLESE